MRSRRRPWIGWVLGVVGAVVALAAAGFVYLYIDMEVYKITVVNRSAQTLTDVRVIMPGRVRNLGTLAPDASDWVYTMPETDGTLDLAFTAAGKPKYQGMGYVTGGLGQHFVLTVTPALTVRDTTPGH